MIERAGGKITPGDVDLALSIAPLYANTMPYEVTRERKWVIRKGLPWPKTPIKDGVYPYVVSPDSEIRFGMLPRPEGIIHHPELVNGKDVVAAGMFQLVNGEIVKISNESGHYCPEADSVNYAVMAFKKWNLPIAERILLDGSWECF